MFKKSTIVSLAFCLLFVVLLGGISFSEEGNFGGTLRYAMIDTPPSLDQHVITADLTTTITQHIFEGLYTFDSSYAPVPLLAKDSEVKNDGKLIVINLRQGVLFHNNKELTAEDVVASLVRWGKYGVRGPVLFNHIDKVEAAGKYKVNLYFKEPFAPWKNLMAFINGGPVIYPREVVENADAKPIPREGYIGTGPYKFSEWSADRYILLERFENYVNREEEADGYGGNRVAFFDKIKFIPVPDEMTRVNGVKAGDYDYAERIPGDFYTSLEKDPSINVIVNSGAQVGMMFFNSKSGMMKDNFKLRRALLAAIDMEPVLRSAVGPEGLWELNGSITPSGTKWYSEAGVQNYSQADAEKAKQLAKEAGYNGEKITFMVTTSYLAHYNSCIIIAKQLSLAGFNIDLQIYDWATLVSRRGKPELWDIFFTTHGFVPDPILYTFLSNTYPGWWMTDKRLELTDKFSKTMEFEERYKIWNEIQKLVYEEVPIIKTGDMFGYDIASTKIEGLKETSLIWPKLWGIWYK